MYFMGMNPLVIIVLSAVINLFIPKYYNIDVASLYIAQRKEALLYFIFSLQRVV